ILVAVDRCEDERIDAVDARERVADPLRPCEVEGECPYAGADLGGDGFRPTAIAPGNHDLISADGQRAGDLTADTRRASDDDPDPLARHRFSGKALWTKVALAFRELLFQVFPIAVESIPVSPRQ